MPPFVLDLGIVAVSLGLFAAAYGGALLATRPARPSPAPATPELGDEPPAVVSLLGNRWTVTEDAAEATLLDLAARRTIELRQPANDPMQTTIHVRAGEPPGELLGYERRVLDRIRGLAVGGVIPVTALTFRNQRHARTWNRRLHREVVADARARGVSQRRFGPQLVSGLLVVAAVAAGGLFLAMLRYVLRNPSEDNDLGAAVGVGLFGFALLAGLVSSQRGERDTAAGRAAAARWLGVRAWLRNHEEFADLPPAAVAVWDRYLPYGAALGVTHTASEVLDLGMGDRRRVWSSYGGRWRRVRVRYPRFWGRYGRGAPSLLVGAGLAVLAGGLLARYHQLPTDLGPAGDDGLDQGLATASRVALVAGVLLLIRGGYRLVRTLIDLATARTITGQVLWVEVWRTQSQGKDRPRVPWLHYLAVDDGSAERTTAWGLPHGTTGQRCRDGDTVTIRVRPWSRRVVELTLVERGQAHQLVDQPVPEESVPDPIDKALSGLAAFGRSMTGAALPADAAALFTTDEVGQALGIPVREPEPLPMPGFGVGAVYRTADRGRQVLMVQVARGTVGGWAWRANQRGAELPGIGDAARLAGDRAVLRIGETTLLLTLLRDARGRQGQLPWLLQQAAARLAGTAMPAPEPRDGQPAA
jgi:hypothetical protein